MYLLFDLAADYDTFYSLGVLMCGYTVIAVLIQNRTYVCGLVIAAFKQNISACHDSIAPVFYDCAVIPQAVLAAVEREFRLIIFYGWIEGFDLLGSYVRRVADQNIKSADEKRRSFLGVCLHAGYHARQTESFNIHPRDVERLKRDVGKHDAGVRNVRGDGESDTAGAGAEVDTSCVALSGVKNVDSLLRQKLGIRAGNKGVGRNVDRKPEKFPFPGDVCDRLALKSAVQVAVEGAFIVFVRDVQSAVL